MLNMARASNNEVNVFQRNPCERKRSDFPLFQTLFLLFLLSTKPAFSGLWFCHRQHANGSEICQCCSFLPNLGSHYCWNMSGWVVFGSEAFIGDFHGTKSCFIDWAFLGGGLKETGAPTERLWQRVNTDPAAMGSMRKIKCFLNIEACKHVLVQTQNTSMNLKMLYNRSPLRTQKMVRSFYLHQYGSMNSER